jgi:hypothetical protein
MTILDDTFVGFLVGTLDVAFLWPFVVIACRREAGAPSIAYAVKQGKLWSGGTGALTMLVPYCVLVESISNFAYNQGKDEQRKAEEDDWRTKLWKAPLTSFIIACGLQPIEKKIVMDSLFQTTRTGKGPVVDLYHYVTQKGVRRLMLSGLLPLWARETIYVASVTILNPHLTTDNPNATLVEKCASAFAVGFSAGMISAPIQTLNVLQKDERNAGKSLRSLFLTPTSSENQLNIKRLFFGSGSRSFRTGAAGVLWFLSRANVHAAHAASEL